MKTVRLIAPVEKLPYPVRLTAPSGAMYAVGGTTVEIDAYEIDVDFLIAKGCVRANEDKPQESFGAGGSGPEVILGGPADDSGQDILADTGGSTGGETDTPGVPSRRRNRRAVGDRDG